MEKPTPGLKTWGRVRNFRGAREIASLPRPDRAQLEVLQGSIEAFLDVTWKLHRSARPLSSLPFLSTRWSRRTNSVSLPARCGLARCGRGRHLLYHNRRTLTG